MYFDEQDEEQDGYFGAFSPPSNSFLLQEDSFFIEQEDGSKIIL